jgi:hypothetical protein
MQRTPNVVDAWRDGKTLDTCPCLSYCYVDAAVEGVAIRGDWSSSSCIGSGHMNACIVHVVHVHVPLVDAVTGCFACPATLPNNAPAHRQPAEKDRQSTYFAMLCLWCCMMTRKGYPCNPLQID